ncbi:MAG: 50S ribosomal protein L29 [Bacteroidetes bacterium]|nr:50S ribosomal protein L29 [Bacteroidota bacterium]MBK8145366.1 50S ribosomal protein L29 [Bacteroidota bacterium]MBP6315005.1 50S ribosomal protein L29 [Chitinophagaceae bacterium]
MAKKNNKSSKIQEIRSMSEQDIKSKIAETDLRLKRMAFSHAITPIENPMAIRSTRREIAQLQTELKRKQLGF